VFVCLVVILTSSIVVIAYIVLLPLILNTYSPPWIAWHICYGHWNLVMIAFHYYKAAKTSPGYPPTVRYQISFSAEEPVLLCCQFDLFKDTKLVLFVVGEK
ncbi:Palmitoyltransferase zdhhc16a, partial [Goodea atripinnis]